MKKTTRLMSWKLTIEYDGTRYYGWQEQTGARTVAGEVRRAAETFLNQPADLAGAGGAAARPATREAA
jgi:tRNA pseudouridine38-40 synthase